MSFLGGLWSAVDRVASQAKMNLKMPIVGTGDQILAISPSALKIGMIASVTANSTGGALQVGIYRWDGSNWTSPTGGVHTHEGTGTGGSIQNILLKGVSNLWFCNMINPTKEQFFNTGTGATFTNNTTGKYVEISTGTTTNNHGTLRGGGILYTFSQPSNFVTRIKLSSSTTSATARIGMGMETADAVTTNTVKYGFEGCATCNSTNISVISSEGTLRSKNTQSTDNYSTVGNFIMQLNPGVDVKYRKEGGTIITKSNNVPATGVPARTNIFIITIQTTNTTAKTLDYYGGYAVATIGETAFPTL